jgi:hypothetical protein
VEFVGFEKVVHLSALVAVVAVVAVVVAAVVLVLVGHSHKLVDTIIKVK